jgi:hypothetical protein
MSYSQESIIPNQFFLAVFAAMTANTKNGICIRCVEKHSSVSCNNVVCDLCKSADEVR